MSLYRFVDPYDPAQGGKSKYADVTCRTGMATKRSLGSMRYDGSIAALEQCAPSVSAANMTPSLKIMPSTDVPVTYGSLDTLYSVAVKFVTPSTQSYVASVQHGRDGRDVTACPPQSIRTTGSALGVLSGAPGLTVSIGLHDERLSTG